MSIVTKRGDSGATSLMYNRRVAKSHPRVESYGAVDELSAALGLARAECSHKAIAEKLLALQRTLILLMGELATAPEDLPRYEKDGFERVGPEHVALLDSWVAEVEPSVMPLKGWALPGENRLSACLELARTACRRSERRICVLLEKAELHNPNILVFLNRLSDLLWLLARHTEKATV